MKIVLILTMTILLSACGSVIKSGALVEAQSALNKADYVEALENTDIAESFGDLSFAETAKLHFMRAQALEGLSRQAEAISSYQYVVDQHPTSAYANAARERLQALTAN